MGTGADLIISDGDDLIPDVLGLRPDGTFGGGALGRMRVDKLVGKDANSAVNGEKGLVVTGVVTATTFKGDGSQLTGVVQSDTPLGNNTASTTFYESDSETTISTDTTLSRASSNPGIIYTKFQQVVVAATKSLIVGAGEVLVVDAYNLT